MGEIEDWTAAEADERLRRKRDEPEKRKVKSPHVNHDVWGTQIRIRICRPGTRQVYSVEGADAII